VGRTLPGRNSIIMSEEKKNETENVSNDSQKQGEQHSGEQEKKDVGYYFDFKEVLFYFFRKKDPNRKSNFNLRAMHTINKISMLMFLICLIIIIARYISRM
jgi:hypothetical protein